MAKITDVDKNMAVKKVDENGICWYDPAAEPFRLSGFSWYKEDKLFRRLPMSSFDKIEGVNPNVNILADNTAGGMLRFKTNSTALCVRGKLLTKSEMNNMPPTGQSGFDCYACIDGNRFYYEGGTSVEVYQTEFSTAIFKDAPDAEKEIILGFPLYNGVSELEIGLSSGAYILPPREFDIAQPIVFYGTSITQGGCASRPGMAYTSIISRRLNANVINLGFSGNGNGEIEIAECINEIETPSCIVIDIEANAGPAKTLERNLLPLVECIRSVHKSTPILVMSCIQFRPEQHIPELVAMRDSYRDIQRDVVEAFAADGDNHIHFLDGRNLFDEYYDEYTVDTVHPSDLGFWKMAEVLTPIIEKLTSGEALPHVL